jgi:hypothetical protein
VSEHGKNARAYGFSYFFFSRKSSLLYRVFFYLLGAMLAFVASSRCAESIHRMRSLRSIAKEAWRGGIFGMLFVKAEVRLQSGEGHTQRGGGVGERGGGGEERGAREGRGARMLLRAAATCSQTDRRPTGPCTFQPRRWKPVGEERGRRAGNKGVKGIAAKATHEQRFPPIPVPSYRDTLSAPEK